MNPTPEQIERACRAWVAARDARTGTGNGEMHEDDLRYFESQWPLMAGLRLFVIREMDKEKPPTLRALYGEACHGAGAEPRRAARAKIEAIAAERGVTPETLLDEAGLDLIAYFASRPI